MPFGIKEKLDENELDFLVNNLYTDRVKEILVSCAVAWGYSQKKEHIETHFDCMINTYVNREERLIKSLEDNTEPIAEDMRRLGYPQKADEFLKAVEEYRQSEKDTGKADITDYLSKTKDKIVELFQDGKKQDAKKLYSEAIEAITENRVYQEGINFALRFNDAVTAVKFCEQDVNFGKAAQIARVKGLDDKYRIYFKIAAFLDQLTGHDLQKYVRENHVAILSQARVFRMGKIPGDNPLPEVLYDLTK